MQKLVVVFASELVCSFSFFVQYFIASRVFAQFIAGLFFLIRHAGVSSALAR